MSSRAVLVVATGAIALVLILATALILIRAQLAEQERRDRVALLRTNVKEWNSWREQNPSVAVDLSGVDLGRVDQCLRGAPTFAVWIKPPHTEGTTRTPARRASDRGRR